MKIFLSHDSADKSIVRQIGEALPERFTPWIDEDEILPGENISQCIDQAIENECHFFVLFLGKNTTNKKWVKHEIEKARSKETDENRPFLIPFLLDDNIPEFNSLKDKKHIKLFNRTPHQIEAASKELTSSLDNHIRQLIEKNPSPLEAERTDIIRNTPAFSSIRRTSKWGIIILVATLTYCALCHITHINSTTAIKQFYSSVHDDKKTALAWRKLSPRLQEKWTQWAKSYIKGNNEPYASGEEFFGQCYATTRLHTIQKVTLVGGNYNPISVLSGPSRKYTVNYTATDSFTSEVLLEPIQRTNEHWLAIRSRTDLEALRKNDPNMPSMNLTRQYKVDVELVKIRDDITYKNQWRIANFKVKQTCIKME